MSFTLKIKVQGGATKTMSVSGDMSIHELCKDIKEKFDIAGGADHGVFYPEQGKWLLPSKIIDFYDLKTGDLLEYKKKHRPLKFQTLDGSIKTAIIDETLPVQQLVDVLCNRIGITNTDEYSLLPEKKDEPVAKKSKKAKNQKVEEQIADDARWLNPDKTLAEQGLREDDIVILKKKFYYTDQNIDRNDPVQLNLLYNQAKEAILSGKHPCTFEEAVQFAAIQCQVQFGNHEQDKHKPGFIKIKEYIPPEYRKSKDVEKKIFHEHRKLQGLTELNSKFRYVQLSRSLKTYGITFFLVQERTKKNKLVPSLIGVTKSSVVKLDMETKDITKEWKLTQLRRWAASPNNFTLDFGDYAEAYYSVQTAEGEQISQLIAGYIDIILKKRKEAEKVVIEDEIEESSVEEYIKPTKATNYVGVVTNGHRVASETRMQTPSMTPGSMKTGFSGDFPQQYQQPQQPVLERQPEYLQDQQAFLMGVKNAMMMLKGAGNDLNQPTQLPPLGDDPASQAWREQTIDVNSSNIANQIAAQLASAASIMNNANGNVEEMNYELMSDDVATLTTNLTQMTPALKLIAALLGDDDNLLDAALSLVKATVDIVTSAQSVVTGDVGMRNQLHNAGRELASAAQDILLQMERAEINDDEQHDLSNLAESIVKAVIDLVNNAKAVSKTLADAEMTQDIVIAAKGTFETANNLVACVNTVNPTINVQQCTDQVLEGSVLMRDIVGLLANNCGASTSMEAVDNLLDAAQRVEEAIARLVDRASKAGTAPGNESNELDQHYDLVVSGCEKMLENLGTMEGIINNTKALTLSSTQFVAALKKTANNCDDEDERLRLVSAAKGLAEATSKMVANAKEAARAVHNAEKQDKLREVVEVLLKASNAAAGPQLHDRALYKLSKAIKEVAASAKQLAAAAKSVAPSNRNQEQQLQLNQAARKVNETIPAMVSGLKNFQNYPLNLVSQTKLIQSGKHTIMPGNSLVASARNAAPSVGDSNSQAHLLKCASQHEERLMNLDKLLKLVDDLNSEFQMQNAMLSIKAIQQEMFTTEPVEVPAYTTDSEEAQQDLYSVAASIQNTISMLADAAAKGNEKQTGVVATEAVLGLQSLSVAVQGFAAQEEDDDFKSLLMNATSGVGDTLVALIDAAKNIVETGEYQEDFSILASEASKAVEAVITELPGQKELTLAIEEISDIVEGLESASAKSPTKSAKQKQKDGQLSRQELQTSVTKMTNSANEILAGSKGTSEELKTAVLSFVDNFKAMVDKTVNFGVDVEGDVAEKLTTMIQDAGATSATLLQAAKGLNADKNSIDFRNQLLDSAKLISDGMSDILTVCSATTVGHSECSTALQTLSVARAKLDSAITETGANVDTYGECMAKLMAQTKVIITATGGLNTLARATEIQKLATKVVEISTNASNLVDVTTRAAYLVGISDPSSIAASEGPVDKYTLIQYAENVKSACEGLINEDSTQKEILASASTVARSTSAICNLCKNAGQNSLITPNSRQQFLVTAKIMANRTASLVTAIKQLALAPSPEIREKCKSAYEPLLETIQETTSFANSPEFAGIPAKILADGIQAQKPILNSHIKLISSLEGVVNTIKLICSNNDDDELFQDLGGGVKTISDSVANLAKVISKSTPGQKKCDETISMVSESAAAIDQAIVESTVNSLEPTDGVEKAILADSIRAFSSLIDVLKKVVTSDPGQLGQSLSDIPANFQQITTYSIASASQALDLDQQKKQLDNLKATSDDLSEFLFAIKASLVGSKGQESIKKIDEKRAKLKSTLNEQITTIEGASVSSSGELTKVAEKIDALSGIDPTTSKETATRPYQHYATIVEGLSKQLIDIVGDIISKAKTVDQFTAQGVKLAETLEVTLARVQLACTTAEDTKTRQALATAFRELCVSSVKLVESMRLAAGKSSADQTSRSKLSQSARDVSVNVSSLITAAKEGSRGLVVCQESIANINDIIGDLESAFIFAQAGQLDPVDPNDNFYKNKDAMMSAAKKLTEQVKGYITAISGTQEELATLSVGTVSTMELLKDNVKKGAVSITSADKNMQQHLLSSTKYVAESLQSVISSSINAMGRPSEDPAITEFSSSVKAEFGAIAELVRVTRLLADESTRGVRALDLALNEINSAIEVLENESVSPEGTCLPDEVATLAKLLATGSASLVTIASRSDGKQDELIAAANLIKKQTQDLCRGGKAVVQNAPQEAKHKMISTVSKTCYAIHSMLKLIKEAKEGDVESFKQKVQTTAKSVAVSVSEIVGATSDLIPSGYVDMSDPNVIAERELLAAADLIEAASKKLSSLKPPEKPGRTLEDLNFEGQILEAAKAIAMASSALVRSATNVQREIMSPGSKTKPNSDDMYFNDGTWSDGLVSASKQVATATEDLCESAHLVMTGKAERDRVIVAAKSVSSSTAQLLSAAVVRAGTQSQSQLRLKAAGKAVTNATTQLVKASEESMAFNDTEAMTSILKEDKSATTVKVMEMEAQMSILKMEKELERARNKLANVRKGKYDAGANANVGKTGGGGGRDRPHSVIGTSANSSSSTKPGVAGRKPGGRK